MSARLIPFLSFPFLWSKPSSFQANKLHLFAACCERHTLAQTGSPPQPCPPLLTISHDPLAPDGGSKGTFGELTGRLCITFAPSDLASWCLGAPSELVWRAGEREKEERKLSHSGSGGKNAPLLLSSQLPLSLLFPLQKECDFFSNNKRN